MKPEQVKSIGTIAARRALQELGADATTEELENAALDDLTRRGMTHEDLQKALEWASRDFVRFKRSV